MPKFTRNLLKGMGAMSINPRMMRVWIFPTAKLLYSAKVSIPKRFQRELVGTELFGSDPMASDWRAVGNDMRIGFIKHLEEVSDVESQQAQRTTTRTAPVAVSG